MDNKVKICKKMVGWAQASYPRKCQLLFLSKLLFLWAADAIKLWDILQFRNLNKNAVFFRPFQWLPQNKNAYPLVI